MTANTLVVNKGVKGLTIENKEKINTLSFPDKDMIKNKKGLRKYCSYVQNKVLNYMSNIFLQKGETIDCLLPIVGTDKIIDINKVDAKNNLVKSLKANLATFVVSGFLGFMPFICLVMGICIIMDNEIVLGIWEKIAVYSFMGCFPFLLLLFLMKNIVYDVMFSYRTGLDSNIPFYIQREASKTIALTNKSIYLSGYDDHEKLFKHKKYDYRDIHYVENLKNSNGTLQIVGTGFDRQELFRLNCTTNEDWDAVFQKLQENVIDANRKLYYVDHKKENTNEH